MCFASLSNLLTDYVWCHQRLFVDSFWMIRYTFGFSWVQYTFFLKNQLVYPCILNEPPQTFRRIFDGNIELTVRKDIAANYAKFYYQWSPRTQYPNKNHYNTFVLKICLIAELVFGEVQLCNLFDSSRNSIPVNDSSCKPACIAAVTPLSSSALQWENNTSGPADQSLTQVLCVT
jgi:hypothetical protein